MRTKIAGFLAAVGVTGSSRHHTAVAERWRRLSMAVVPCLAAAAALSVCGGSAGASPSSSRIEVRSATVAGLSRASALAASEPKISPPFVSKAQNVCAGLTEAENRLGGTMPLGFDPTKPQPSLLKEVGRYFDEALPLEKSVPRTLLALGEPAAGAATWNKLRSLADQFMTYAEDQARDATAGDAKGFVTMGDKLTAVGKEFDSVGRAGGFEATSPCSIFFG